MSTSSGHLRSVSFLVLLLLSSAISRAQTQNLFFQPPSYLCQGRQATADFNQDGKLDLACSDGTVWLGSADGTLHSVSVGAFGQSIAVADFNGDGKLDIAFASYQSTNLTVSLGNGDGTFQSAVNTNVGIGVVPIAVADVNRDGKPDLVGISSIGLLEFLGHGDGTFAGAVQIPLGSISPFDLIFGDFNGDGKADIVVGGSIGNQYVLGTLLGNGDGTFQSPIVISLQQRPNEIVQGDFNNDRKLDLVIPTQDTGNATSTLLFLGNGDGTFQPPLVVVPFGGDLGVADLNGDGNLDLAIAASFEVILLGNGDGTFTWVETYLGGFLNAAGDFTGDGKPDLATGNSVLLGNGDGTFQGNPAVEVGGTVLFGGATGDFNGDGIPDIAVTNGGYGGTSVSILLSDGTGKFRVANSYSLSRPGYAIATSDLNGDGKLDLVVIASDSNGWSLNVLLGNGDGNFGSPMVFPQGVPINDLGQIVVADFNGDHKPDLAVLSNAELTIFLGNGDGTFASPVSYFAGSNPSSLIAADFNNDGKIDVAVAYDPGNNTGGLAILLGDGNGTFNNANFTGLPASHLDATADLNGDGKADLVADYGNRILLGKGDGTFDALPPTSHIILLFATLADLNGDGKLDLLTEGLSGVDSLVNVSLGNGDGTFSSPITVLSWPTTSYFVLAADFNRDNKPDLAVSLGAGVVTLLNVQQPGFTVAASPLSPATVAAGDSATTKVTVTPTWGFKGSVSFSCSKLPSDATCSFNPGLLSGASGTSALTIATSTSTPTGTYLVNIIGISGSLKQSVPISLVVTGFSISGSALSPSSVSPGGSASSTVLITPLNGFNANVTFSCSSITLDGSPATIAPPTCSFNPASVTNGSGSSTLTVSTTANSARLARPMMHHSGLFYALWLPIGGVVLIGAGFSSGSRRKRRLGGLLVCLMLSGLLFLAACGGGSSSNGGGGGGSGGTPSGTYAITVKATAGSTVNTTNVMLTVQ